MLAATFSTRGQAAFLSSAAGSALTPYPPAAFLPSGNRPGKSLRNYFEFHEISDRHERHVPPTTCAFTYDVGSAPSTRKGSCGLVLRTLSSQRTCMNRNWRYNGRRSRASRQQRGLLVAPYHNRLDRPDNRQYAPDISRPRLLPAAWLPHCIGLGRTTT